MRRMDAGMRMNRLRLPLSAAAAASGRAVADRVGRVVGHRVPVVHLANRPGTAPGRRLGTAAQRGEMPKAPLACTVSQSLAVSYDQPFSPISVERPV